MKYLFSICGHLLISSLFASKCSASFPDTLEGRCYWSTSVVDGGEERELVPNTHIELCFEEDNELRANAGCNFMMSSCNIEPQAGHDHLDCGLFISSKMYCGDDFDSQDMFVEFFLSSKPSIDVKGKKHDKIVLSTDTARITFSDKKVADPDRPLVGTEWGVTGFVVRHADMLISLDNDFWVFFGEDSNMSWSDGCGQYTRSFEVSYSPGGDQASNSMGTIEFGDFDGEFSECDDRNASRYAGFFNAMFHTGEATYTVDGPSLRVVNSEGSGVSFQASSRAFGQRTFDGGYVAAE